EHPGDRKLAATLFSRDRAQRFGTPFHRFVLKPRGLAVRFFLILAMGIFYAKVRYPMPQEQAGRTQCSPPERVILGIDPGVAIAGYAVLVERQGQLTALACDVICTPARMPLADRLHLLHEQVSALLTTYHPTEAAMES